MAGTDDQPRSLDSLIAEMNAITVRELGDYWRIGATIEYARPFVPVLEYTPMSPQPPLDTPADIAADLHQLADEVLGNATRPAATDIAARCNQAAKRLEQLVAVQAAGRATLSGGG